MTSGVPRPTRHHASRQISQRAQANPNFVNLLVGELPAGVPPVLLGALRLHAREGVAGAAHQYAPTLGVPALRWQIAQRYARRYGLSYQFDTEVLVTAGATEGIWSTLLALTEPGDEVVLFDPGYMVFASMITALGRVPVSVDLPGVQERGLVAAVRQKMTDKTRLLILNTPENPTGRVYGWADVTALVQHCVYQGVYVMHDEVYDDFIYEGHHCTASSVTGVHELVITVNSFSKRLGVAGWRVGWLTAHHRTLERIAPYHAFAVMNCPTPLQLALAEALEDPALERHVERGRDALKRTRDQLAAALIGLHLLHPDDQPQSGFYLFLDARPLAECLGLPPNNSSTLGEQVALHLAERAQVAVMPGVGFGASGANHVRLAFTVDTAVLQTFLDRLRGLLQGQHVL